MIRINLREYVWTSGVDLTSAQVEALRENKLVTLRHDPGGSWSLKADKELIGAIRLGDGRDALELHIEPKLPVERVLFLVGYADRGVRWHHEPVDAEERPGLLPAIATAFARMADRALAKGVLSGYQTIEEALPMLRGRLREAEQIRRRFGALIPAEVRYDDYSPDIPENQILVAATIKLLRLPGITGGTRALLHRVRRRLDGVTPPDSGQSLPQWRATRLNTRYHAALGIAELVLRDASYELRPTRALRVDGLILRMWQIFESFVSRALSDALKPYGGYCEAQSDQLLDHAATMRVYPDLIYYRAGPKGRPVPASIGDAKYKVLTPDKREDFYQMVTYCAALDAPAGHLIYAAGPQGRAEHHLKGAAGITVQQHVIDLHQPPHEVLAQTAHIAKLMSGDAT